MEVGTSHDLVNKDTEEKVLNASELIYLNLFMRDQLCRELKKKALAKSRP